MIASTKTRRSYGLGSTRSPSNACAQRRAVDRVSDIGRLRLNCEFRIVGQHVAAPRDIDQDLTSDICAIVAVHSFSPNQRVRDFAVIFPIKRCSSSL